MVRGVSDIDTVGVVGAGTMGSGIAQVAAAHGYQVVLRDVEAALVDRGMERVQEGLERLVERGDLTESDAAAAAERVTGTEDLTAFSDADFVVEAVVERMDVKREVFEDLDDVVTSDVVLATNTSTLSITAIGAATERPELVGGLHFMNPPVAMPGVEVVAGERTSEETLGVLHGVAESMDKETWEADDKPGFVVNRILMPWINAGIRTYDEGVTAKEDVDRAMRLGTNVPMGPLELADHIGLDVCLEASETLHDELGEEFRPPYLLQRKVAAGDLGKKTGAGFYRY